MFDGAYSTDDSKLRTVMKRARDKISQTEAVCQGRRSVSPEVLSTRVQKG